MLTKPGHLDPPISVESTPERIAIRAGTAVLRDHNRALVLRKLWQQPGLSRADLSRELHLAKSTISAAVAELLDEQLICEGSRSVHSTGRPTKALHLDHEHNAVVAWEINVGSAEARVMDLLGNTRQARRWSLPDEVKPFAAFQALAQVSAEMLGELGNPRFHQLCLALPAIVEANNFLYVAPNLGWRNLELQPLLAKALAQAGLQLNHPPIIENDANAAALGNHAHSYSHTQNFACLHLGVGLGGGLILNGRLYGGNQGFAGEVGHLCLNPEGPACRCGKRGCAEAYLSQKRWEENPNPALLEKMAQKLALLIGHVLNGFDPQVLVLGGPLMELIGKELLEKALMYLPQYALEFSKRITRVELSPLGKDSVIQGAGALAIRQFFEQHSTLTK